MILLLMVFKSSLIIHMMNKKMDAGSGIEQDNSKDMGSSELGG